LFFFIRFSLFAIAGLHLQCIVHFHQPKRRCLTSMHIKKNRSGRSRVCSGRPGPGSTGFFRTNFQAGFCLDPDRSYARVGWVPGRAAGPVRVSKQWLHPSTVTFSNLACPFNLVRHVPEMFEFGTWKMKS
jgi:hypothetical protein